MKKYLAIVLFLLIILSSCGISNSLTENNVKRELIDLNTFRIEKGFKMWGNEMNCDGSILEAGLEAFVRMKKKSDFIGKEALKQKLGEYRQQKLLMLEVDVGNVDPEGNESVWLCGKVFPHNNYIEPCGLF